MTNAIYGGAWVADTVGILSKTPVRIRAIEVDPSAAGGLVLLNWWDEANPLANSSLALTATASSGTVTDDASETENILTAAAFPDGAVVKVKKSSGAAANMTYHLIGTAGNNDAFVVTPTASWADEANIKYTIEAYPARTAISITTPGTEVVNEYRFFGSDGIWFPNLTLETVTNVTKVVIYLA